MQSIRDTFNTSLFLSKTAAVDAHVYREQPAQLGKRQAAMLELSCFSLKSAEIPWKSNTCGCTSNMWQCYAVTGLRLHKCPEDFKDSGNADFSIEAT